MSADILLIDDEEIILQSLSLLFRQAGLAVDIENNPIAALERYRDYHYRVVLVDVIMPGMQGAQVIRAVKEINPLCNVIVMTAYSKMTHVIDCIEAGATDYVTKPFTDVTLLIDITKAALERSERWRASFGLNPSSGLFTMQEGK